MINKIKEMLQYVPGITYLDHEPNDGDGTGLFFSIDFIDTLKLDEDEFYSLTDFMDSIDFHKSNFEVYISFDSSGYDYWNNIMNEPLSICLNIWVSKDFNDDDLDDLYDFVEDLINKVEANIPNH